MLIPRPGKSQILGAAARLTGTLVLVAALTISGWPNSALAKLIVWIVVFGVMSITGLEAAVRAGWTRDPELSVLPPRLLLKGWIEKNEKIGDDRRLDLFRQVFYDGRDARSRMSRYALLMFFATIIATAGVIADSTAVVIGAMLIAPLITPMMGMALGLVMGWQNKLLKASSLVAAGLAIAVGVSWILPNLITTAVDVEVNSQIVSRTSPTLLDLVVAIAAGAAGSYALARPDVSSSLPGVAIAIALVPPLCVAGVLLHLREWSLAAGAGLLFSTNLIAILVTGGIVFLAAGTAPLRRFNEAQNRSRVAFWAVGVVGLMTIAALTANGAEITRNSLEADEARATTLDWLDDAESDLALVSLVLDEDDLRVVLAGTGDPPDAQRLADLLSEDLGRSITLDLQWVPRNQLVVRGEAQ